MQLTLLSFLFQNRDLRDHNVLKSQSAPQEYSIWNIARNPKAVRYPKGKARHLAEAFNDVYTFYLISYEKMVNAFTRQSRRHYRRIVNELERAFHILGLRLVQTPLRRYMNKHIGPNLAPTFEINFDIARTEFLEQIHIIKKLRETNWNINAYIKIKKKYVNDMQRRRPRKRQTPVAEDESEEHVETYEVYQPLHKSPYIDFDAIYYDLPIV